MLSPEEPLRPILEPYLKSVQRLDLARYQTQQRSDRTDKDTAITPRRTDDFISSLIQLAFGTCAAPLVFELFTAISYASTAQTSLLWNVSAIA